MAGRATDFYSYGGPVKPGAAVIGNSHSMDAIWTRPLVSQLRIMPSRAVANAAFWPYAGWRFRRDSLLSRGRRHGNLSITVADRRWCPLPHVAGVPVFA